MHRPRKPHLALKAYGERKNVLSIDYTFRVAVPFQKARSLQEQPRTTLLDYLDRVCTTEQRGDAREESFYPCFLDLLRWAAEARGRTDVEVTLIPRKTESCLLDFQVWRGRNRIAGYVEAKRPGTDLGAAAESEQVLRYRRTFPNLLLTNFREVRLYRGGALALRVDLTRVARNEEQVLGLFDTFFDFAAPPVTSASGLAVELARRTRVLEGRIEALLEADEEEASDLAGFFKAFSVHLLHGLTRREFADLYAQTVTYGLLAARWQAAEGFDRQNVARHIPRTNGILREVFQYISLGTPPPEVGWIVDDLVDLLAVTPVRKALARSLRGGDPVLHFYETFLRNYDRDLRKQRGVYYTPQPLVSYVVRSVHRLLQTRLGRRDGLADPSVTLLDPAAGTLTFVVEAIRCAVAATRAEVGDGAVPALVRDHLLRDFYAFELMMAPYAMGHLKVSLLLEELGQPLTEHERFKLYLTNALEREDLEQSSLPGAASLSRESRRAGRLKKEQAMTVVLGNPPWSGHTANPKTAGLIAEAYTAADGRRVGGYRQVDGVPLKEKNLKWLQDDYVKFLRFAQRKVDEAGEGVVAFVTNHSYLDNPTFRGLRRSLLESFDEVYLLDLHGNGKKKERAPDGGTDGNVFAEIRQGAAVALLVKKPGLAKRVFRADLWGSRATKLEWLEGHDVESTPWSEVAPAAPAFLFHPRDALLEAEYARGFRLTDIFPAHSVGIVTGRDAFAIDTDLAELRLRVNIFRGQDAEDDTLAGFGLHGAPGGLAKARGRARLDEHWEERFARILYRPFDRRHVFYADYLIERPRRQIMDPLLAGRNLGLIVPRQSKEEFGALVTDGIAGHKAVSAYDINSVFPLYLRGADLWGRTANLGPVLLDRLEELYGERPAPQEILNVVYAVLYSPLYRSRYADLLKADFPRVPFPADRGLFLRLAGLGAVLVDLHLLRSDRLSRPAVRFEGGAFTGISPEVWAYRIGGYQVLEHWLADRAGKRLSQAEIEDFRRAAAALALTIEYQREIDRT